MSSWAKGSTLRGMESRARSGFAPGSVPFGYTTVKTAHAGGEASKIEIDPIASEVVRRIFRSYADGHSQATIAATLNASSSPAPRPRRERRREGWRPTSVRNILRNAKYRGVWSFGLTKWVRDPDTGHRRPLRRDAPILELLRPDLAIVDAELWSAVRARLGTVERTHAPSSVTRSVTIVSARVAARPVTQRQAPIATPSASHAYECFHCRCSFDERSVPSEFDHFPIPASRGGAKTVRSCVECHALIDRGGIEALPKGVTTDAMALAERAVGGLLVGTAGEFDNATDGLPALARIIAAAIVKRSWFER